MNNTNFIGNICTDIKALGEEGNTVKFMLAVRRNFKNKQTNEYDSDFIPCIAFGNPAKIISENFSKGSKLAFSGRYQSGNYENQEGKKIYTHDIVVGDITFVESKKERNQQSNQFSNDPFANGPDVDPKDLPF